MNSLREYLFAVIQPAQCGNVVSKVFDIVITSLVLVSVICVFAVTFEMPEPYVSALNGFEVFASIVFSVEYLVRIATADLLYPDCSKPKAVLKYVISGMAIVDLLAILPLYLPMLFPGSFLAIRIFRLLRVFRIFKLNRYFESMAAIGMVIRSKSKELVGSSFFVVLMLVISSLVIYTVEHAAQPEAFKNAFSGLWWAVATLTTVGYGDIYPVTAIGRVFGAIIALLGIGMVAIPTGIISSGLIEHMSHQKGSENAKAEDDAQFQFCPHCGKQIRK